MSTQSLSSVATDVVGQYSQVGKLIVGAYRTGAQRLLNGANARYAALLNKRSLPLVNDDAKASLIDVQQQIAGLVESGVARSSDRVEQAIDFVAGGVNSGIKRIVDTAGRVQSAFDTKAISTVGSLTMPVAHVSLEIANRAVEGTKRLTAKVAGAESNALSAPATPVQAVKKTVRRAKTRN